MMSGGSAGLRTMIALPRVAPPTSTIAWLVVSVNSSILARVPGPALFDAMDATISPYCTLATRFTAATIGIVACPPQENGQAEWRERVWNDGWSTEVAGPYKKKTQRNKN